MEGALYEVLDAALTGVPISAGTSAVSSILACAAAGDRQHASLEGLSAAQVVRALLHAAASCKHAQAVLLDIQSAAALYPATVPLLLQALGSEQRQHLQDTLTDLGQQQQHLLQLELQQQQPSTQQQDTRQQLQYMQQQECTDLHIPDWSNPAVTPYVADAQLQPWVSQLHQLGVWDVLLLLGLCGDPQWEAEASMLLLTAVNSMQSLQQVSEMFMELSAVSDGAADWLLSVGIKWAVTCYLDMEVDGSSFEQAGLQLLQGGVWSMQQLAQQGLGQILQQLKTDADPKSPLWRVLQYIVSRCIDAQQQLADSIEQQQLADSTEQQQLADSTEQQQQQQRPCNLGAFSCGVRDQLASTVLQKTDIAVVCMQQLLAELPEMLKHSNINLAKQYIVVLQPLAVYSCDVGHALLAAAGCLLQPQFGLQQLPQVIMHRHFNPQQLLIKQELYGGKQLESATAEAAAAVAALAGTTADVSAPGRSADMDTTGWGGFPAIAGGNDETVGGQGQQTPLLPDRAASSQQQQQQQLLQHQEELASARRPRYSWGFGRHSSKSPVTLPAASGNRQQQQTALTFATPLGSAGVNALQHSGAAAAGDVASELAAADAPFLALGVLGAVTTPQPSQKTPAAAATDSHAHHDQQQQQRRHSGVQQLHKPLHRLQVCDAAASQQRLEQLLQQVAVRSGGSSSSYLLGSSAASLHGSPALTQVEQVVIALLTVVLQEGTPCSGLRCQQQLVTVLQLIAQSSPAALQRLCDTCSSRIQRNSQQQANGLVAADSSRHKTLGRVSLFAVNNTHAVDVTPAYGGDGGGSAGANGPDANATREAETCWPMHGLWQQALEQLLQQLVDQLPRQAVQQPATLHCSQHTAVAEQMQMQDGAHGAIVSLPIVLHYFLDTLPLQVAARAKGITADQATASQEQQLQHGSPGCAADGPQPQLSPQIASLLGQLLLKLLVGWGMSEQPDSTAVGRSAEPQDCRSRAAAVRDLLIRHHTLSHLLAWILQHPAASQQIVAAAAAAEGGGGGDGQGCLLAAGRTAQQGVGSGCDVPMRSAVAAAVADAAVEVEGSEFADMAMGMDRQLQVKEQHPQAEQCQLPQSIAATASADAGSVGYPYTEVAKRMALQLQHMQAVLLPTALQQLLAAKERVKAQQRQQMSQSGNATIAASGGSSNSSQQCGQVKQRRNSFQFFIVHTPAERKPTVSQMAAQQQSTAAALGGAAAASKDGDVQQMVPQHLLQLPTLPLDACHELLLTSLSQLVSAVSKLRRHQQQHGSRVGADKQTGAGTGRARRSSSAAPSAGRKASQASQQEGPTAAAAPAPATDSGLLAGIDAAHHNLSNVVSPAALAADQQQAALQLLDFAITSALASISLRTGVQDAVATAPAAMAAGGSSSVLLQLHQQLSAMSALLSSPAGVTAEGPTAAQLQQQQQIEALACAALSAAAQLLECWWPAAVAAQQLDGNATAAPAAAVSDESQGTAPQQQQQQQLEEYAKLLRASLAVIHLGDCAALDTPATSHCNGSLSWADVALVFGHNLGSGSWSAMKRLQQQEQLLAAMLDLLIKVHQLIQAHKTHKEQHVADASMRKSPPAPGLLTALIQQLAVLSAAAEDVCNPAAGAPVTSVGDARWLYQMLVSKAQELVTGQILTPDFVNTPDAAKALVKVTQPSYLRTSTPNTLTQLRSSNKPCSQALNAAPSKTLALSAHLLSMQHSPRVYVAAEASVWGRQGFAFGAGAGPGWVVGCSRAAVSAAARMMLQLLAGECEAVQDVVQPQQQLQQGPGAGLEPKSAAARSEIIGGEAAVVAGTAGDVSSPPTRQCVQLWRCRTAATAAVLDCSELLLYHQATHARHQQQQQGTLAARRGGVGEDASKARAADNSCSSAAAAEVGDNGVSDLQLAVGALAAALAGPCTAAAEQMTSVLRWQLQQQQDGQSAGLHADTAEAALQGATAAAGSGSSQASKPLSKKQSKRAATAAAADPVVLLQAQLSMLLGLGCAAGKLVLAKRTQLLQSQQQQQQGVAVPHHHSGVKAAMQQLMQSLRTFSSAYKHLVQNLDSAAAAAGVDGVGPSAAAEVTRAMGELLDPAAQKCAAQSRKEAWAAVAAAAAVLDDSCSDDSDSDPEDCMEVGSPDKQQQGTAVGKGPVGAAAADPASRFYDPEVHEELPCTELSEVESEDENSKSESDSDEVATSDGGAGGSRPPAQEQGVTGAHAVGGGQMQQSRRLLHTVFSRKLQPDSRAAAQQQQQQQVQAVISADDGHPRLLQQLTPVGKPGTATAAVAAALAAAKACKQQQQQQHSGQLPGSLKSPQSAAAAAAATKRRSASNCKPSAADVVPATSAATTPYKQQQTGVPVVCGSQHATFEPSSSRVTLPDGSIITPSAFEKLGGKGSCKKWKNSVHIVAADGAQGETLGRWLSSPAAAGIDSGGGQPYVVQLRLGNSSRKRKRSREEGPADAERQADALGQLSDVSDVPRLSKKSRVESRVAGEPQHHAQQLRQQQQSRDVRRSVPVPVTSAGLEHQQRRPGTTKHLSSQGTLTATQRQQRKQMQKPGLQQEADPATSSGDEARARNAFVQACLAEGRVPGYSSEEESEDDSDYSDLEDFIVVQPGKDYSRVCAEAGGKLSWKHKWQQVPGAGLRRD